MKPAAYAFWRPLFILLAACLPWFQAVAQVQKAPTVRIIRPADGETIEIPAGELHWTVPIIAAVIDPDSFLVTVDFLADGQKIGSATGNPNSLGPLNPFQMTWFVPSPGSHQLQAVVTDEAGNQAKSEVVHIKLVHGGDSGLPIVTVAALKKEASELGDLKSRTLIFQVIRTGGSLEAGLTVFLSTGGTASPDSDYLFPEAPTDPASPSPWLFQAVNILAGHASANVVIEARFDEILEGPETVVLKLEHSPLLSPETYLIGEPSSAEGVILDGPLNDKASIVITHPVNLEEFKAPAVVEIAAVAVDPLDEIRRVEFYAGDLLIGVSEILTRDATIPGRPREHHLRWADVPAGEYKLVAKGKDTAGNPVASDPIHIIVSETGPGLRIISPPDLAEFVAPAEIDIQVKTGTPGGPPADIYANDQKIGTVVFIIDPCNGVPGCLAPISITDTATFHWSNVAAGKYVLTARSINADGTVISSLPVRIGVHFSDVPVVSMITVDHQAVEPDPADIGIFKISRTGSTANGLAVFFEAGGTATRGGDYVLIPESMFIPCPDCERPDIIIDGNSIEIPAGHDSVLLGVRAISDKALEGVETAVVALHSPPVIAIPGVKPSYQVGVPGEGKVAILDNPVDPNRATLVLTSPPSGSVFRAPAEILLVADGMDPNGALTHVDFFANDQKIGESEIVFIRPPDPGTKLTHEFLWKNVPAGAYQLTARSKDANGADVVSEQVLVRVEPVGPPLASLRFNTPHDGDTFGAPASIAMRLTSFDPNGHFEKVEIFANGGKIGDAEFCAPNADCPAPSAGRPTLHSFGWSPVPAGTYTLVAKGTSTSGIQIQSDPIQVKVGDDSAVAFINFLRPGNGESFPAPASVAMRLTSFDPSGYFQKVELFANGEKIGEAQFCAPEAFCPLPSNGRPTLHSFGWQNVGAGEYLIVARGISTSGVAVQSEPMKIFVKNGEPPRGSLVIDQPKSGDAFRPGERIRISMTGIDPTGYFTKVEVYSNGQKIGDAMFCCPECLCLVPEAGKPSLFTFDWNNATAGVHELEARGVTTSDREYKSDFVRITVGDGPPDGLVLVARGSEWKYLDDGSNQGTQWREPEFSDSEWRVGPAQLGFGDGDEATLIRRGEYVTAYFRRAFEVADAASVKALKIRLLRDDGGIVYLNGKQVFRSNMPDGPVAFDTLAAATVGGEAEDLFVESGEIPAGEVLRSGRNVLAVEVHQVNRESSDISFDLELRGRGEAEPGLPVVSILAADGETMEPSITTRIRPGSFSLHRSGDAKDALRVWLTFDGTATNGRDYAELAQWAEFPAGVISIQVLVAPLDDELVEGDEHVIARLTYPPTDGIPTYRIDPDHDQARVVIHDNEGPISPASIVITSPKNGDVFTPPARITIAATAIDPNGYIPHVVFYANFEKIGESIIVFIQPPDPGSPIEHTLIWENVPAGEYKIVAVGNDSAGKQVASAPVSISVRREAGPDLVTIEVPDAEAVEEELNSPSDRRNVAVFVLKRTGPLTHPLKVFYSVGGSAKNGLDYEMLDGDATFAAGQSRRELVVRAKGDGLLEGNETVVLELKPDAAYQIGNPNEGRAVIHDAQKPDDKPSLVIVGPKNGARLPAPDHVRIDARGVVADGWFVTVEFFADNERIGLWNHDCVLYCPCDAACDEVCTDLPDEPGKVLEMFACWYQPRPGEHKLSLVGKTSAGVEVRSEAIVVVIERALPGPFVIRSLPELYQPGVKLTVILQANPGNDVLNYALEDAPPEGWTIGGFSEGGALDATSGKVKFGPFFDHQARTLSYAVTPPANAGGVAEFRGSASADGVASRIGGDQSIRSNLAHPADRSPANFALTLNEVTDYGAAWKTGTDWPAGPNPIPIGYVTRAGALWKGGEGYVYDPAAGPAPLCWINAPTPEPQPASDENDDAESLEPEEHQSKLVAWLHSVRAPRSVAVAERPVAIRPGEPFVLKIHVFAGETVKSWAVEESVPEDAVVAEISDGGVYDSNDHVIRWGPFVPGENRTLSCQIATSKPHQLAGVASFDGRSVGFLHLPGPAIDAPGHNKDPHIAQVAKLEDGSVQLLVLAESASTADLEVSGDLRTWRRVAAVNTSAGGSLHLDTDANENTTRFYRVVPR